MSRDRTAELDQQNIWHPLTQHATARKPLVIDRAEGNYLYDHNDKAYLDCISSWYSTSYGHCNPQLTQALKSQSDSLHHLVFSGMTHSPAAHLSDKLMQILPANQKKIFFSENGSTAVEVGIKLAYQYHHNANEQKDGIVALENGFHGDTLGAMSASGLYVYNGPFGKHFMKCKRIPAPTMKNLDDVLDAVDKLIADNRLSAFVYEPLVQGAAGMQMYDAEAMGAVLSRFRESGILLIADEVMTGFGKTGTDFASDQISVKPDIMCMAKALTGGIMPMAITSCSQSIYDRFYHQDMAKGFFHGHTYSGNPLACRVASEAISLLKSEEIQQNIRNISAWHRSFIQRARSHPNIKNLRSLGTILAMEWNKSYERYGKDRDRIFNYFWERGYFVRPLGSIFYMVPPFTLTYEEAEGFYDTALTFAHEEI